MTRAWRLRRAFQCAVVVTAVAGAGSTRIAPAADPAPAYFSYGFGSNIQRVATGPDGRIYLAGWTPTTDLPASTSHPDPLPPRSASGWYPDDPGFLFVAALAPDGQPLWTSYIAAGGNYQDMGVGAITAASDGSIWLVGAQRIATVNAFRTATSETYDGIFAKFSTDGEVLVASYLDDQRATWVEDVVVDASGDAFITGSTSSATFPGAPVESANGLDGFVSRIRSDGSGVVWTQRFRGTSYWQPAYCGGVARDPSSGTIVVSLVLPEGDVASPPYASLRQPEWFPRLSWHPGHETAVIRLDPEGDLIGGTRLPFLPALRPDYETGLRTPIAIAPDGSVLVAGFGQVVRLSPALDAVLEATRPELRTIQRIATDARGRVFVIDSYRPQGYEWHAFYGNGAVLVAGPGDVRHLTVTRTLYPVVDLAVDGAGGLAYVGEWPTGPFNAPPEARTADLYGTITRVPIDGIRSPSRIRARTRGPDAIDLRWSDDGDPVVRFEVIDVTSDARVVLADDLPPAAHEFRAVGVTPGAVHFVGLVSVFANGVRSVTYDRTRTPAVRSASVVAADADGQAVDVTWHDPNGRETKYLVERRVGDGPWVALAGAESDAPIGQPAVLHDLVPDVAADVTYRVRSALHTGAGGDYPVVGVPTPWTVSAPIRLSSSLRVMPAHGAFRPDGIWGGRFLLEGRFTQSDGRPGAPFDPRTQELRLLYGDAARPNEFVLTAGDPGWTESGGVWTWSAARTLNEWDAASEVVISPVDGTFRVRLESRAVPMSDWSGSVAFNLRFGEWSGGDVRAWTRLRGFGAGYVVEAAAAPAIKSSDRTKESAR
jgi:hypothetical protein